MDIGKLPALQDIGLRVDDHGRLSDWRGWPPAFASPHGRPAEGVEPREKFSASEVSLLTAWVSAGVVEGFTTNALFEQLEVLCPTHSWMSWQNKARDGSRSRKNTQKIPDDPFPNLNVGGRSEQNVGCPRSLSTADAQFQSYDIPSSTLGRLEISDSSISVQERQGTIDHNGDENSATLGHPDQSGATSSHYLKPSVPGNVVRMLNLQDTDELDDWMAQPWVVAAYVELAEAELDKARAEAEEAQRQNQKPTHGAKNRSVNHTQVNGALHCLLLSHSRYLDLSADKSFWTRDDHAIRFIARIVKGGQQDGNCWASFRATHHLRQLCEKARFFLNYLQWLHRPTGGTSKASRQTRLYKKARLSFLARLRSIHVGHEPDHRSSSTPRSQTRALSNVSSVVLGQAKLSPPASRTDLTADDLVVAQHAVWRALGTTCFPSSAATDPLSNSVSSDEEGGSSTSMGSIEVSATKHSVNTVGNLSNQSPYIDDPAASSAAAPTDDPPATNPALARDFFTSEHARMLWINRVRALLQPWGISERQGGICVLVPQAWRDADPLKIITSFTLADIPSVESGEKRLDVSVGGVTRPWARFSAWFNQLRQVKELEDLFPTGGYSTSDMQGSHLCHHGLCVVGSHIVWETQATNFSRVSCHTFAKHLRSYGGQYPVPPRCNRHEPPCLMQHAALTTQESLLLQFSITRQAYNQEQASTPSRPATHPQGYDTFEHQFPIRMAVVGAPAVEFDLDHLVQQPVSKTFSHGRDQAMQCVFCIRPYTSKQIYRYWSHVKYAHNDVSSAERLDAVKVETAKYLDWIREKRYDRTYLTNNPTQWNRMQQTQLIDFDWSTFISWRLPLDSQLMVDLD